MNRQWSPAEDARLITMIIGGDSRTLIAERLGRPRTSIDSRLYLLRAKGHLSPPTSPAEAASPSDAPERGGPYPAASVRSARTRPCMCCQKSFRSDGSHNRLCLNCRTKGGNPFAL